ncbi:hypothetical protein ANCCAN_16191 [Ancylostoma caninum]|uniref:Uncharacterized protein n=1 Tax=Ancylostoma caninum TaxID=29170 RepID=A0A368G3P8_ANCCA|nr:hypothetical protein ANCCAN_16191 [Ancylostoma caninum]
MTTNGFRVVSRLKKPGRPPTSFLRWNIRKCGRIC